MEQGDDESSDSFHCLQIKCQSDQKSVLSASLGLQTTDFCNCDLTVMSNAIENSPVSFIISVSADFETCYLSVIFHG